MNEKTLKHLKWDFCWVSACLSAVAGIMVENIQDGHQIIKQMVPHPAIFVGNIESF
jgi:hypothetical protein